MQVTRIFRSTIAAAVVICASLASSPVAAGSPCWRPPVDGRIVDSFRAPPCPYCAGNRGLEFEVDEGASVLSAGTGTVTFSGVVARTRYVVVELANGWKLTYGKLAATHLVRGDRVVNRSLIGRSSTKLFMGLRIDGEYRDPEPYLGRAVGRPRLVPIDGTRALPSPEPRWVCAPDHRSRR